MTENAFSPYVRILGKGKTGSRSLSENEAFEAMNLILEGKVEDVQLGAFLMLLRVKEESAEELAGFVKSARSFITKEKTSTASQVDLDWSSYAGKRKQPHWFILSALALSQSGYRVLMHGTRGHTEGRVYTEEILEALGITACINLEEAESKIADSNFAYIPLGNFCPPLERIIGLRPMFGLRSPVHTLCRLINPLAARGSLQSVFHPSYMQTHHEAASLLGEQHACVLKGDSGEVEYRPHASVKLMQIKNGQSLESKLSRRASAPEIIQPVAETLIRLWQSENTEVENTELENAYGYNAVLGTIAIALLTLGDANDEAQAFEQAHRVWENRDRSALG